MCALALAFSPRFIALTISFLLTLTFAVGFAASPSLGSNVVPALGVALFGALTTLGVHDLLQDRHAVLRNYPISAHLRFLLEGIRPEMRQYFFESETDGLPYSRSQRAIEIKLSQGAKPGHGGVLPGPKVTAEIAAIRGVAAGKDCVSPAAHSAFSTPIEMMHFIGRLRALSGGKPIGFKLCVGHPWEFLAICKAMIETGIRPDFIVVDGKEGGTGAAPLEFTDRLGMPMREGLVFVRNALVGAGLRDTIRLGVSGKIANAFDMACAMASGADWCNAARGFMFSLGCIQSLSCHTDRCPTGVATQDKTRSRAIVVEDKTERVRNFHRSMLNALAELTAAAGLDHPQDFRPAHFSRRVSEHEVMTFADLYPAFAPGELLSASRDDALGRHWAMARPDSFSIVG